MKTRIAALSLTLLLQILSTQAAFAWSDLGHMAVAYFAYQKLTPAARARVNALVKLNPFYEAWKAEIRESGRKADTDMQLFMLAASWPDQIKKDSRYTSDGSEDGNKPDGGQADINVGYSDHLMHKYWHFYDLAFSTDKMKLPASPSPNALTQITKFRKTLASDAPDELKSYDLCWLLHLVGDVHQPLHCTTRCSKDSPDGDDGGNDIFVRYNTDKYKYETYKFQTFKKNRPDQIRFHWFWDSILGANGVGDAIAVGESLTPAKPKQAKDLDAKKWVDESFKLAREKLYKAPILAGRGPFELTSDYEKEAIALGRERVALAGERLANILNKELK